jgi:hypothetical protein
MKREGLRRLLGAWMEVASPVRVRAIESKELPKFREKHELAVAAIAKHLGARSS